MVVYEATMIGLIDADILVFRAGFAAERNQWFVHIKTGPKAEDGAHTFQYKKEAELYLDDCLPGIYSREEGEDYRMWSERYLEPVENALHLVKQQMNKIMDACDLTEFDVVCYLSGGMNFRYEVATTRPYKGNRDAKHRPTHEEAIKDYIRGKWNTVVTDGIEADDQLGIDQCRAEQYTTCIISIDKDLNMIPGLHYDFLHDLHYEISEEQGWYLFCKQLLTGDTTDNIPGLEGIGPKKADKILDGLQGAQLLEAVSTEYASRSGKRDWFAYLREQAALIWILREERTDVSIISDALNTTGGTPDGEPNEISLFD